MMMARILNNAALKKSKIMGRRTEMRALAIFISIEGAFKIAVRTVQILLKLIENISILFR